MGKESLHAQTVTTGHIAVEWGEDVSYEVAIQHFDFETLAQREFDAFIAKYPDHAAVMKQRIADAFEDGKTKGCVACALMVINDKRPQLTAMALAYLTGVSVGTRWDSLPGIAKHLGVSKQAVQKKIKAVQESLGLRQLRSQRNEEERGKMRERNYRKNKI